jgi:hypothetical protein
MRVLQFSSLDDLLYSARHCAPLTPDTTLPPALIEHTSLPSGLHTRGSDFIVFTHHGLPGGGLFRSRTREGVDAGRGRRMATLGAVLGE